MSFCSVVKNELLSIRPQNCCKDSFAYAFMLFGTAFSINKISRLKLSSNLQTISHYAFYENYLGQLSIPNSVKSIGVYAFYDNDLYCCFHYLWCNNYDTSTYFF